MKKKKKYTSPSLYSQSVMTECQLMTGSQETQKLEMEWKEGQKGTDASTDYEVLVKRWHDEDEWN